MKNKLSKCKSKLISLTFIVNCLLHSNCFHLQRKFLSQWFLKFDQFQVTSNVKLYSQVAIYLWEINTDYLKIQLFVYITIFLLHYPILIKGNSKCNLKIYKYLGSAYSLSFTCSNDNIFRTCVDLVIVCSSLEVKVSLQISFLFA